MPKVDEARLRLSRAGYALAPLAGAGAGPGCRASDHSLRASSCTSSAKGAAPPRTAAGCTPAAWPVRRGALQGPDLHQGGGTAAVVVGGWGRGVLWGVRGAQPGQATTASPRELCLLG